MMPTPSSKLSKLKEIQQLKNISHQRQQIDKLQELIVVKPQKKLNRVEKIETSYMSQNSGERAANKSSKLGSNHLQVNDKHSGGQSVLKQKTPRSNRREITVKSSLYSNSRSPGPNNAINTDIADIVSMMDSPKTNQAQSKLRNQLKLNIVPESQRNVTSESTKKRSSINFRTRSK